MQLRRILAKEAIEFLEIFMDSPEYNQAAKELDGNEIDQELFDLCLEHAEGDELKARNIYLHRRSAELKTSKVNLDEREKWPMLMPLLVLYTLGTIGVLLLVFGFLGFQLNWW